MTDDLYENAYEGQNSPFCLTWVIRISLTTDSDQLKLAYEDNKSSIILKNESVYSALEYGVNKLMISLHLTDLLIVHNWKAVVTIGDSNPSNFQKYWLAPLPGFDLESFPFVAVSGSETFNIINVSEYTQEQLIQIASRNTRSQ